MNKIQKKNSLIHDFSALGAAISMIENSEIVLQKGYVVSNVEKEVKVNSNKGFNVGLASKTSASWGMMQLVEEGKIDLDARAEKYLNRWHLPESVVNSNEVTIRRLLSHTAELSFHG